MAVTDRGFINVDIQYATPPHIFAIGDIVGQPMWRTRRCTRAHVAAEVIAGELQEQGTCQRRLQRPRDPIRGAPTLKWRGRPDRRRRPRPRASRSRGALPLVGLGPRHCQWPRRGLHQLLFDDSPEAHGHGKILGGGIVDPCGDMIGDIALIQMGADAVDIGKTIHPHRRWARASHGGGVVHGSCTDVPPARKKSAAKLPDKAQLATVRALRFVSQQSPQNTVHL